MPAIINELGPIFKALSSCRGKLGKKMYEEIRERLVQGMLAKQEAHFLQELRRDNVAEYLGMSRENYEKWLDGKYVNVG